MSSMEVIFLSATIAAFVIFAVALIAGSWYERAGAARRSTSAQQVGANQNQKGKRAA